jgi:hypothetical protein
MAYRRRQWIDPTEREVKAKVVATRVKGVIEDTKVDRLIIVVQQRR